LKTLLISHAEGMAEKEEIKQTNLSNWILQVRVITRE
jgi:hypothetical protein